MSPVGKQYPFPSLGPPPSTSSRPAAATTVFRPAPQVIPTRCFSLGDGSSSETDEELKEPESEESEEEEDTIVRYGWVYYKGEMRRLSELSEPGSAKLPIPQDEVKATSSYPLPKSSVRDGDDRLKAKTIHCTSDLRSEEKKTRFLPYTRRRFNSSPCIITTAEDAVSHSSPLASPVYNKRTPFQQKVRKSANYRTVFTFEDEEEEETVVRYDADFDEEDDDIEWDSEQDAPFLVTFVRDDEEDSEDDFF